MQKRSLSASASSPDTTPEEPISTSTTNQMTQPGVPSTQLQRRTRRQPLSRIDPSHYNRAVRKDKDSLTFGHDLDTFSGWVYVAELRFLPPSTPITHPRIKFTRQFCQVHELICTLYASESDIARAQPLACHVLIAVTRVHVRNKTFIITDHEDHQVLIHSTMTAVFEDWYQAFAMAVRTTGVAKSQTHSHLQHRIRKRHQTQQLSIENTLLLTAAQLVTQSSSSVSSTATSVTLDEPRAHSVWLYVQHPLWRTRTRKYFVVCGTTLSCFHINIEGQCAEYVATINSYKYDAVISPLNVDIFAATYKRKKHLLLSATKSADVAELVQYLMRAFDEHY